MALRDTLTGIALALILVGVLVLEAELYPDYRGDSNALMNVNAVFAIVLAGLAATMCAAFLTNHELGGSAAAIVMGWLLFLLLLQSAQPRYYLPPLAVFAGGLSGVVACSLRSQADPTTAVSAAARR